MIISMLWSGGINNLQEVWLGVVIPSPGGPRLSLSKRQSHNGPDQFNTSPSILWHREDRASDIIFTNCSTNVHECVDNYRIRKDGNWLLNFVDRFYQALLWICPTFFIKYLKYVNSFCALRSFFKIYFGTRHHYSCTIYPVHVYVHVLH